MEYPDSIRLQDPQKDHNLVDNINARILQRVSRLRLQGTIKVLDLERGDPYSIQAGDTLDIRGFEPDPGPQRIVAVRYNRDGTVDCTLDRSYDLNAIVYRAETRRFR